MGLTHGGKETLLSAIRPCRIEYNQARHWT